MRSSDPLTLSIVFVTYNSADTIGAALDSVKRYLPDAEIVVVDNGSGDQTGRIVRESSCAQLLEGHGNIGFGGGVNLGARIAGGDLLIVLNPDAAIVDANVERLDELARRSPVGLVGCRLRDAHRARYLKYSEWGWRRELCWLMVQWFLVPREIKVHRPSSRLNRARRWISGAAFIVDRNEFLDMGGFDEEIYLYFEDVDLSRRYREHGDGVGTTDALVVTHKGQGSTPGGREQIQGWALLSFIELVAKWDQGRDGKRAARSTLRLLDAISTIATAARVLPFVGPRALTKARSASTVRSAVLACIEAPPTPGAYPRARALLADVWQAPERGDLR